MLEAISHDQFEEWLAADRLGILDDQWEQFANLTSILYNQITSLQKMAGAKVSRRDFKELDQFLPPGHLISQLMKEQRKKRRGHHRRN